MWFLNVFLNLVTFVRLIFKADRYFRDERPDAVVLVDYPGFHWWIARRAKARGIPVIYFVPPQIWAWAGWRIKKIKKYVDLVLCSLPFEPDWYRARGFENAVYVGHPYFDELKDRPLDASFLAEPARTIGRVDFDPARLADAGGLAKPPRYGPGREQAGLTAPGRSFRHRLPARTPPRTGPGDRRERAREGRRRPGLEIEVHAGKTPELIRLARAAWAVSGSVGLELLVETLPTVVLYKIRRFDLWVASFFIKSRYISLVNLLAEAEVFPEYLTWRDSSDELVRWGLLWLDNPAARDEARSALATLRYHVAQAGRIGQIGATDRALAGPRPRRKTRAIAALWSPRAANPVRSRSRSPCARALSRLVRSGSPSLAAGRVYGCIHLHGNTSRPAKSSCSWHRALNVRPTRTTASRGRCSSWPGAVICNFRRSPRFNFALS